ncbi:MAG: glycolate oxidase subunit GlcF [Rhizomicrobium sp.]
MRTNFSPTMLADPHLAAAEKNLRACVHCGICTATCPTYVLLGDERDGPRGRIVMMQRMLEEGGAPSAETVLHIDRCLSCLGCRTACPSGVDYAQLVDASRAHIEEQYRRPLRERALRFLIANLLTRPTLTNFAVGLARAFAPIATRLPGALGTLARTAMKTPPRTANRAVAASGGVRIALLPGCVQQSLAPDIDRAAARVLGRRGFDLVPLEGAGCCGALAHHLGRKQDAKGWAKRIIEAFERAEDRQACEGALITATGCAAHLADYPRLFADEPVWRACAERFAAKLRDFSALAGPRPATAPRKLRVAFHRPCSLQHGLKLEGAGEAALEAAGFEVVQIPEGHLCCGSAGSYSILQPELAGALRARKLDHAKSVKPDMIAAANIGCLNHLAGPDAPPLVHPAELIDWAEGGPVPAALGRIFP